MGKILGSGVGVGTEVLMEGPGQASWEGGGGVRPNQAASSPLGPLPSSPPLPPQCASPGAHATALSGTRFLILLKPRQTLSHPWLP